MTGKYQFFPWIRQGIANLISAADTLDSSIASRAVLQAKLRINDRDTEGPITLALNAPGDVTGFSVLHIVRTVPRQFARTFEANLFPAIEFDRPDFPWLFTPARAETSSRGRLRPWICLVVVRQQEGVVIRSEPGQRLPVLEILFPAIPGKELPDLTESWAWAHAQVTGDDVNLDQLFEEHPERLLSRLIAPRRLDANTQYFACVVPAFENGRKAGLGEIIEAEDEQSLKPAWESGTNAPDAVTLPIYYHWEFSTGSSGDFESLARRLRAMPAAAGLGRRKIEVRNLPFGLPDLGILNLEGALRPLDPQQPAQRPSIPAAFQAALRGLLNQSEQLMAGSDVDPVVAPAIYGRWQAARSTVPDDDSSPQWLPTLNLNPMIRVASGFGTLVVQDQQEQLMASAWEQLGQIERINQELRQAQLNRAVGQAMHDRLANLTSDVLLQITGPVHQRMLSQGRTVHFEVLNSRLPGRVCTASFRRIVRPRGPLFRRLYFPAERNTRPIIDRLATGEYVVAGSFFGPKSMVESVPTSSSTTDFDPIVAAAEKARFQQAAKVHEVHVSKTLNPSISAPRPALDVKKLQATLHQNLAPESVIAKRMNARLRVPTEIDQRGDSIEPIMKAPDFPQPMYEALRDLSQDLLVPGMQHIEPDSVTLLATNPEFVESYMVGLNHEMSRELLWRRYPTDQRGTYFKRFWNTISDESQFKDIHEWDAQLGKNFLLANDKSHLVLLIRGELLRQFSNTIVYAVEGVWEEANDNGVITRRRRPGAVPLQAEEYPVFRGTLEPDITFLGFNLSREKLLGAADSGNPAEHPGWFFVFQEHATEPRFGLDVASCFAGDLDCKPRSWQQLSWGHFAENDEALSDLSYVRIRSRQSDTPSRSPQLPDTSEIIDTQEVIWGFNAAHIAFATLQKPARVVIHARSLIALAPAEDES